MSIGTGIFLSALFLGCIVLYVKSENKAKWRKCLLTSLGGLVAGLVAAGVILFVGVFLYDAFEKYTETPRFPKNTAERPTDMMGIRLGETLANLQFERGKFWNFKESALLTTQVNNKAIKLHNGVTIRFPNDMSDDNIKQVLRKKYFNEMDDAKNIYITDTNVIIHEKDGRAERLDYDCKTPPTDPETYFHKIQCGNTASDVMQAYGQNNVTVLCSDTDVETRLYDITGKNIRLWLTKNAVQRIEFSTQPFSPSETFKKRC
jgi:hypothetical protein